MSEATKLGLAGIVVLLAAMIWRQRGGGSSSSLKVGSINQLTGDFSSILKIVGDPRNALTCTVLGGDYTETQSGYSCTGKSGNVLFSVPKADPATVLQGETLAHIGFQDGFGGLISNGQGGECIKCQFLPRPYGIADCVPPTCIKHQDIIGRVGAATPGLEFFPDGSCACCWSDQKPDGTYGPVQCAASVQA